MTTKVTWAAKREQLERLLAHLERRSLAVDRDLRRAADPLSTDEEDQAVEVQNDEVLVQLQQEGAGQVELVRSALARIDAGTYGTCADCGGQIAPGRLDALPYASVCIDCAHARETAGD
ncbi:MAG: TraR/DksA family transcriptional regulator [Planctomycetota bacterium]